MAFEAHIREISHEGGMLAPFTGDAPKLGQIMQLPGGKWVGKVDTVIGEVSAAVVHISPFRDTQVELLVGQPVELAPPKEKRESRRERNDDRGGPDMKAGDWICEKCRNHNFAWRDNCNRCEAPKTGGGGGQRRDKRGGDRRGGGGQGSNRDNNDNRPPRREYRGSNDRRPRRDSRKPGGWGPKSKGGPRKR